jgi:hypothetical protein
MSDQRDFQAAFVGAINASEECNRQLAGAQAECEEARTQLEEMAQSSFARFGPEFIDQLRTKGIPITIDDQGVVHVSTFWDESAFEPIQWADPRSN